MKGRTHSRTHSSFPRRTWKLATLLLFFAVAAILISGKAHAQNVRISGEMAAHHALNADAVETYYGEVISTKDIENFQNSAELLKRRSIKTSRGELSPQEIEYILINSRPPSGNERGDFGDIARPPHI